MEHSGDPVDTGDQMLVCSQIVQNIIPGVVWKERDTLMHFNFRRPPDGRCTTTIECPACGAVLRVEVDSAVDARRKALLSRLLGAAFAIGASMYVYAAFLSVAEPSGWAVLGLWLVVLCGLIGVSMVIASFVRMHGVSVRATGHAFQPRWFYHLVRAARGV